MRLFFILFFLLFSTTASTAYAQLDFYEMINPDLLLRSEPEYPGPGENVTISLNEYEDDTYGATITWLYNGQVVAEANNRRSVVVNAGALNTETTVEAVLNKTSGDQEILSTTIKPIYLDINIEAQTRVPEFYIGKALPSVGSMVNAKALVNDGTIRTDLVYTWRLNRDVLEEGPIRNRNQVSFATPMGNRALLSVEAAEPSGNILARKTIALPSVVPSISFYEVSSLFGMKQKPVNNEFILVGNSTTLQAEPYNLDIRVYNNPDIAQWEINGSTSQDQGNNPYQITFQSTGVAESARLGFHVRDTTTVLQGARDTIQVNF